MGADFYMMGKWERERKHDNGEYIERKPLIAKIEERIAMIKSRANSSNDFEQFSGKELYGYGASQVEWVLKLLKGESK